MLGRGLLGVAIAFSAYALVAAPASMRRDASTTRWVVVRPELLASARRAVIAVAIAIGAAAVRLWIAFFTRDFSIAYVAMNTSRAAQPWYTFSAFWSGMAGSLLLWSLILSIFAAAFVALRRTEREPYLGWAIPILCGAQIFYLAITAFAENPFAASDVVPLDGRGMNPLLHSPGMLIHPPLLYMGLIGLIVPFALVCSALITRAGNDAWIAMVRRWTLVPWLALGAGLVLGGAWAYTELGWGGYWGWDPVENAAFMPWLAATAFIHSAMVQERRGTLRVWNVFLIVTAASLATFGAFLTRSGLLSSVHTFAESPIGRWFFAFLGVQAIGGLAVLVWRLPSLRPRTHVASPISKESAFLVNNLVFLCAAAVVLWGTVLPLASEAFTSEQIAVGPTFFNRVLAPVGAVLLLLASVGTVVPWRRANARRVASRLSLPAAIAIVTGIVIAAATRRADFAGLTVIATLLAATSVVEIVRAGRARAASSRTSLPRSVRDLVGRNPRRYGGYIVHLGVAFMVVGFAGSVGRTQTEIVAEPGDRFDFAGYTFTYDRLVRSNVADKDINLAVLDLSRGGRDVGTLRPQMNVHRNWDQPQSEIAIRSRPTHDLYVVFAGIEDKGDRSIFRIHNNPLVQFVWIGAAIALVGGSIALLVRTRVVRVDAPAPTELQRA